MRKRDPAKIAKIQAAYYIRHKPRILKRNADYRAANLDKVNDQKRDHTEAKKKRLDRAAEVLATATARAREIVGEERKRLYGSFGGRRAA